MTTKEMLKQFENRPANMLSETSRVFFMTTSKELRVPMEQMNLLRKKISDDVNQLIYERSWTLAKTYAYIDANCYIAAPTMKKALQENGKITRKFLYKYTIGMHMPLDRAQEYFELQGRRLQSDNDPEDMIAYNAIRDGDSADSMISEFWTFLRVRL